MPERAPVSSVLEPEPVPHCLAWVKTLQASAPLVSSMRMPEMAVGPRNGMLLQVAGARIAAAPLLGVKPPNSGPELPDPQAASEMRKTTGMRLINCPPSAAVSDDPNRTSSSSNFPAGLSFDMAPGNSCG